ncbi:Os12g0636300 [Oryza sativa Japonica Group]|uniref:Os12g0636300 protein n=1 Tax=Oryza sativa subsp. japonica TaxID=39947 RepID=A0A0P0YDA8_ORYSJ|nr:hypothetical protein EE612_061140 [Oryza sativa]BAT18257.1 Os12g0636300 [Oryza sativa Japonica Group]
MNRAFSSECCATVLWRRRPPSTSFDRWSFSIRFMKLSSGLGSFWKPTGAPPTFIAPMLVLDSLNWLVSQIRALEFLRSSLSSEDAILSLLLGALSEEELESCSKSPISSLYMSSIIGFQRRTRAFMNQFEIWRTGEA